MARKAKKWKLIPEQRARVEKNLGLARWIADYFMSRAQTAGFERADIISCAYIGLCKAARDYEEGRGKFSTYATHTMTAEIRTALRDNGNLIHLPRHALKAGIREPQAILCGDIVASDPSGKSDFEQADGRLQASRWMRQAALTERERRRYKRMCWTV